MDSYKYHRRPRRARLSHRSLDWQPNDHLGRSWSRPHLFEHRRQILRGCTESDAYSDSNTNGNSHTYANADFNSNADSDSNGDSDSYGNCDGNSTFNSDAYVNGVTKSYSHAEACTDTEAAPDSATTTLALK